MKKIFNFSLILTTTLFLTACSWVELTPAGQKVRVLSKTEVSGCTHVGKTHVSTKGSIAGSPRPAEQVQSELDALARNSAPDIKGDTVVPVGKPIDGKQVYEVYRCVPPAR